MEEDTENTNDTNKKKRGFVEETKQNTKSVTLNAVISITLLTR